jgi:uncharacterized protein YuzE
MLLALDFDDQVNVVGIEFEAAETIVCAIVFASCEMRQ